MSSAQAWWLVAVAGMLAGTRATYQGERCYLGMACAPSLMDVVTFGHSLDGEVLTPLQEEYVNATLLWNRRKSQSPAAVAMCESLRDVRSALLYARKHRLLVSILSSGHSFPGRSAHDGSLQINLKRMQRVWVDMQSKRSPAGEITVESGNTWARVYEIVDSYQRVIVGGSAHTVAMGGYTQGGGHSPMSRSLGLAVDSLVAASVVTSEGRILNVTKDETVEIDPDTGSVIKRENGSDLFWALRGGGGGTWGVVVTFTFKLHPAPSPPLSSLFLAWPFFDWNSGAFTGRQALIDVLRLLPSLPRAWGGYLVLQGFPTATSPQPYFALSLLHAAPWSDAAQREIEPIMKVPGLAYKTATNFSTFWEYEKGPRDGDSGNAYLVNTLVQNDSDVTALADMLHSMADVPGPESAYYCTGTLLGGKTAEPEERDLPVSDRLRTAVMSLSCSGGWPLSLDDERPYVAKVQEFGRKLRQHGKGVYYNEPEEQQPDWQRQFWDGKYQRLLQVKRKYDPDSFLWCPNCVGDDDSKSSHSHPSQGPIVVG